MADRVNHGRLGPKGLHGWEANHSPDRLTRPLVRSGRHLAPVPWDQAMELIVRRSRETIHRYTPGAMAFYNSGQLTLEEYYTLSIIGDGGVGTPHMDGNTRLCTATADAALKESFGADGNPGCYEDIDECDTLFMVGHNVAETQTVMWQRVLDRLESAEPPKLVQPVKVRA